MERPQICVTIPKECAEWLNKKVQSRIYATKSHAIEVLILNAMKEEANRNAKQY